MGAPSNVADPWRRGAAWALRPTWRGPGAGGRHEALSPPPPSANGEHWRYEQRGRAQGHWRAPNRGWNNPLSGSANQRVPALRPPALLVAGPWRRGRHGRSVQRGWPLAPGAAWALHSTWLAPGAGGR